VVTDDPSVVLPEFLRSVAEGGDWPETVIVVDNAPAGRARPEPEPGLPVTWLRNPRPQPMGRSLNQALSLARSRVNGLDLSQQFMVCARPDLWLAPDALALAIGRLQNNLLLGYAGMKIRRAHVASSLDGEQRELELTDTLDVAGFVPSLFGRLKPLGIGEPDQGQYDALEDLEPAPACIVLRWSALERISRSGPWFPDAAGPDQALPGLLRRLRTMQEKGRVVSEAVAWRLAARPKIG
jgi:hypothetical protein